MRQKKQPPGRTLEPLSPSSSAATASASTTTATPKRFALQTTILGSLVIVALFVAVSIVTETESSVLDLSASGTKLRTALKSVIGGGSKPDAAHGVCQKACLRRKQQRGFSAAPNAMDGATGVDWRDRTVLLEQATQAKERLLQKLRVDYGEWFEPMFVDPDTKQYRPFGPITEDGPSLQRLTRKLQIKVLSMQEHLVRRDSYYHGCDCNHDTAVDSDVVLQTFVMDSEDYEDEQNLLEFNLDADEDPLESYVWATGGHSAAAGHGNLYNESYTAYLESDVKDVFASIGINFEARNYAMGGTSSASRVSMCFKEIFGTDVDFIHWDYGMTDGIVGEKELHYLWRAALSTTPGVPGNLATNATARTMPAAMLGDHGNKRGRVVVFQQLEELGLAAFWLNETRIKAVHEALPDSTADGYTQAQLDALPEYVRHFKCDGGLEKGGTCDAEKYSSWVCTERKKKANWHPGFKWHAVHGHGMALFLMEALLTALRELSQHSETDPQILLAELRQQDADLHNQFVNADLPDLHTKVFELDEAIHLDKHLDKSVAESGRISHDFLFRAPSMCHTARLPAQTRYHGYLVNDTRKVGFAAPVGQETYFVGQEIKEAHQSASSDGRMRIAYEFDKEREPQCPGIVKPDYPDSWYTNSRDNTTTLVFPNAAEQAAYGYDPKHYQGMILFHPKKCDWGNCPKEMLQVADYPQAWKMIINGVPVTRLVELGKQHPILATHEGGIRFAPNPEGRYEIAIRVSEPNRYLEVADFVLY